MVGQVVTNGKGAVVEPHIPPGTTRPVAFGFRQDDIANGSTRQYYVNVTSADEPRLNTSFPAIALPHPYPTADSKDTYHFVSINLHLGANDPPLVRYTLHLDVVEANGTGARVVASEVGDDTILASVAPPTRGSPAPPLALALGGAALAALALGRRGI